MNKIAYKPRRKSIPVFRELVHLEGKPLDKLLFSRQEWNTFLLGTYVIYYYLLFLQLNPHVYSNRALGQDETRGNLLRFNNFLASQFFVERITYFVVNVKA
jgi:hypothetical protein